jgi:hypothetical protein
MTPNHPRWDEFTELLEGPGYCDFRSDPAIAESFAWECDNTFNRPLARKALASMGATEEDIENSLADFAQHGGMCDCEILFNVQDSYRPRKLKRRRKK